MKRNKHIITLFSLIFGVLSSQDCNDGYSFIDVLPETATILDGDYCLSDVDLDALSDLIGANNLTAYDDSTALEVGNQTWNGGRVKVLQASYSPSGTDGVNTQLTTLPASFGNLSELASLYLEWNNLTSLPESFSQLTSLSSLTINNNWLTVLPSDIGNLQNLLFLDLGYNQLGAIPASVCTMESLIYLYLFNNELTALPDCMCNLSIDWNGQDGGWSPYFASGGNYLCEDVPDCIESSSYFENTLDQFYYSAILDAPQGCCMEEAACNFNENATVNNDCEHPGDEGTDYENECDCDGNVADCAGDCDGSLIGTGVFECIDQSYSNQVDCVNSGSLWEQIGNDCNGNCGGSAVEDCAGLCGGYAVIDDCGVCGGNNSTCDVIISFGVVDGNAGTAEIYVVNNEPIAGFQFDIIFNGIPVDISGASGGSAESAGFLISSSSTTVLGFSLTGASIPAGEGVLIVVEFNYDAEVVGEVELCLTNVVLSNTSGHSLSVSVGDCAIMAPSECDLGDVNGDYIYNVIDIVILANCILSDNCDEELPFPCSADINGDGMYNVIDIVILANCILSDNCDDELLFSCSADINEDGLYNVLDIVLLANCILGISYNCG